MLLLKSHLQFVCQKLAVNILFPGKAGKPYFMMIPEIILKHDCLTDIIRESLECTEKCALCTGTWAETRIVENIFLKSIR